MDDLCTAPGADDLTFGSLLDTMIRRMFVKVETQHPRRSHRYYLECSHCEGNDMARAMGESNQIDLVQHEPDCLLAKHLPRLKAMANKGVT